MAVAAAATSLPALASAALPSDSAVDATPVNAAVSAIVRALARQAAREQFQLAGHSGDVTASGSATP